MRYRLSAVILCEPFAAAALRPGTMKDGNLSSSEGFILDRIDDVIFITHPGGKGLVKAVPWSGVAESSIADVQPAWSDWPALAAKLYAPAVKPVAAISDEEQPQVGAPVFPGQKPVDGRTREAREAKAKAGAA